MVCLCHMILCLKIVWGNTMPFSTKDISSYIATGNVQRFQFLHVLAIMAGFLISCSWLCPQRLGQCPAHSSVQFSHSIVSDSARPHGLQHARFPCPSSTPRAYSNSCPSSQRSHPTISSSVIPFSFCLQSCPASGFFPMSQFFASDGQSIGASASASVLPMNIQDWFPLGLTAHSRYSINSCWLGWMGGLGLWAPVEPLYLSTESSPSSP